MEEKEKKLFTPKAKYIIKSMIKGHIVLIIAAIARSNAAAFSSGWR